VSSPTVVIAKREFLERVRSKWFVIVTVLGPVLMIAAIVIPTMLSRTGAESAKVEIADRTGKLAPALATAFEHDGWRPTIVASDTPETTLLSHVETKAANGFIIIAPDALVPWDGKDERKSLIEYQGDNASSTSVLIAVNKAVAGAVIAQRAMDAGITPTQLVAISGEMNIKVLHSTGQAGGQSGLAVFAVGYALMIILYISILLYGVAVMRSVVQEKTSRVIELMVATAKPRALMAGKILGVGAVGLLQLSIWLGMGLLTMKYREGILGMFGVSGGQGLPPLELDQVAVALLYFIGGYFFYAAMYAAVGAMVSSDQEAQQAQAPVMMLVMIPMLCMQLVANNPRGSTAAIMTMVPFSSPILMPMRYLLGGATLVDVLISAAILFGSTYLVVRAAAKIYRVGILLYGKRPNLKELIRWLRY